MRTIQIFFLCPLVFLTSCGYKAPANATPVSKIKDRVFLSNSQASIVQIIDAQKDVLSTFTISVSASPTKMFESSDKSVMLVYDSAQHQITAINNSTETQVGSGISLPDFSDSLAISPNGQVGYAALPTATCSGATVVGGVAILDLANSKITNCVAVAGARTIVLSHNGSTLLVFSDNSNTVNQIKTATPAAAVVPINSASFDLPVSAVFSADDSSAFVLSCGPECGDALGAAAVTSVSAVGTSAPISGASIALPTGAARVGLLNGGTLYVAGTNPTSGGQLEVLNVGNLASGPSSSAAITDGVHDTIALQGSSVFIGARGCSNTVHGCVSIYDTGSKQVFFNASVVGPDDVTGMEPIPGRTVVYVCEGAELRIYDAGTHALQALQINIVGNASDVREVF